MKSLNVANGQHPVWAVLTLSELLCPFDITTEQNQHLVSIDTRGLQGV
jgi:hypothetical protein